MSNPTNDGKLDAIFRYIEKHKKEQKKEKWMLKGLALGMIIIGLLILVVII